MIKRCGMGWLLGLCLVGAVAVWLGWPQPVVERPLVIWSGRNIPELTALGREFTARTGRAVQGRLRATLSRNSRSWPSRGRGRISSSGPMTVSPPGLRPGCWRLFRPVRCLRATACPRPRHRCARGQDRGARGIGCWVIRCNWSPWCCSGIALSCRRRRGPIANFPVWHMRYPPESICWAGI